MKKIIAINGSPRSGWNTDILVREAAAGAASTGAEVEVIDLYKLEKFTGCVSCFGCKMEGHPGQCVCRDGLHEVLEKIRRADGLAIFAHPYWLNNVFHVSDPLTHLLMERQDFDAFEVLGGENYYQHNGYQTALYYEEWKHGRVHPIVGSTDSHGSTEHNRNAAICSTIVFSPKNERKALITSIKEKYSVAVDTISAEFRLVGEERFQRYACFLMHNWYPIHDRFCATEGYWMKEHFTGANEAAGDVLTAIGPRGEELFDKYFVTA